MSRPSKNRRICEMPQNISFGPVNMNRNSVEEKITLTVDEYEVLRLIDYNELNQEECAKQMNVARSTVQRVYNIARKKMVTMLVEGCDIHIQGGNFMICDESYRGGNSCGRCRRQRGGMN